jgi:hypothetical protein
MHVLTSCHVISQFYIPCTAPVIKRERSITQVQVKCRLTPDTQTPRILVRGVF